MWNWPPVPVVIFYTLWPLFKLGVKLKLIMFDYWSYFHFLCAAYGSHQASCKPTSATYKGKCISISSQRYSGRNLPVSTLDRQVFPVRNERDRVFLDRFIGNNADAYWLRVYPRKCDGVYKCSAVTVQGVTCMLCYLPRRVVMQTRLNWWNILLNFKTEHCFN